MIWIPQGSFGKGEALVIKLLWLTKKGFLQLIRAVFHLHSSYVKCLAMQSS